MKALTLIQPWATLIFDGRKRVETRSWGTPYRGALAIHAGKKVDRSACEDAGYLVGVMPVGLVLCVVQLVDCVRMTEEFISTVSVEELRWGNYEPGRFAWMLAEPRPLPRFVEARGSLGLWNFGTEAA